MFPAEPEPAPHGRVDVDAKTATVRLRLSDAWFRTVAESFGGLHTVVRPGIYHLAADAGSTAWQDTFVVRADESYTQHALDLRPASVAPLDDTSNSSAAHADVATRLSTTVAGTSGAVLVLVRDWMSEDAGRDCMAPTLAAHGEELRPVATVEGDGCNGSAYEAVTGAATVRFDTGRAAPLEVPIWCPTEWQTLIFAGIRDGRVDPLTTSVYYHPAGSPWQPNRHADLALEVVNSALRTGTQLQRTVLAAVASLTDDNPMLLLAACYAALADLTDEQVDDVVDRLRRLLPDHPDVVVLSRLRGIGPVPLRMPSVPPMYALGYRALVSAAAHNRRLLPRHSLAETAIVSAVSCGPWTAWEQLDDPLGVVRDRIARSERNGAGPMDDTGLARSLALPLAMVRRVRGHYHTSEPSISRTSLPHDVQAVVWLDVASIALSAAPVDGQRFSHTWVLSEYRMTITVDEWTAAGIVALTIETEDLGWLANALHLSVGSGVETTEYLLLFNEDRTGGAISELYVPMRGDDVELGMIGVVDHSELDDLDTDLVTRSVHATTFDGDNPTTERWQEVTQTRPADDPIRTAVADALQE